MERDFINRYVVCFLIVLMLFAAISIGIDGSNHAYMAMAYDFIMMFFFGGFSSIFIYLEFKDVKSKLNSKRTVRKINVFQHDSIENRINVQKKNTIAKVVNKRRAAKNTALNK